jgi:protein deglycase
MKGLIIFSTNMEDGEALATRALLVRAGFEMHSMTFEKTKEIMTSFGLCVKVDYLSDEIDMKKYDFIVIPGGKYVSETIDHNNDIQTAAKQFYDDGKVIAAICAGPRFLGRAHILDNVHFTAYHGSELDAPNGYYHPERKAMTDGKIITARGAGAVVEFVYEIVKYFKKEEKALSLIRSILF